MKQLILGKTIAAGLVGIGIVTLIVSCRSTSPLEGLLRRDDPHQFLYGFSVEGCETGIHEFSSQGQLCEALMDEPKNHGCAKILRQRYFEDQGCESVTQKASAMPLETYLEI